MKNKKIPFAEGMWVIKPQDGRPTLLGSRCPSCGELFFPKKEKGICVHCQYPSLENVELGREGKIVAFTTVLQAPAGGAYFGPVPYNYGLVDLVDGIRVETQLGGEFEKLKIGQRVVLTVEKLYTDKNGNEVEAFIFRPLEDPKRGGKQI
jgi:hypothetical protein